MAIRNPYRFKDGYWAMGGIVSKVDGYNVHTFYSSDYFAITNKEPKVVEALIVGGGGAGGPSTGGGGGAGGVVYGEVLLHAGTYPIVIGAGGVDGTISTYGDGQPSKAFGITAFGGGKGGATEASSVTENAHSGGSGGGGQAYTSANTGVGSGTLGQGHAGGVGNPGGSSGGGGGAGEAGGTSALSDGGDGVEIDISGTPTYYGGGGGGAISGIGGLGGGGNGGASSGSAVPGTPNTGGGGGGGWRHDEDSGREGGSGIVIVRFPTSSFASVNVTGVGNTVGVDGDDTVVTFIVDGDLILSEEGSVAVNNILLVDALVVGGGGGGGSFGGGGGAGGYIYEQNNQVSINTNYEIIVGEGGAGQPTYSSGNPGSNGQDSSFNGLVAIGGGGGGSRSGSPYYSRAGVDGGSGGGSSNGDTGVAAAAGTGVAGQGNDGGVGRISTSPYAGGGGGGAGQTGFDGTAAGPGDGGDGLENSITGTPTYYAGGGAGAIYTNGGSPGVGGLGGGGSSSPSGTGQAGTPNTGGGGASGAVSSAGGKGGSGVVIIRWLSSEVNYARVTGDTNTVTEDGAYTVATFNESGSFTLVQFSSPKKQEIEIYNSDTETLTDFQVKLTVPYDTGMGGDFSILGFTKDDGVTVIPHWVQEYTSGVEAIIWVKVDIPASSKTKIHLNYADETIPPSSGDDVFEFFDDFTNDLSKWDLQGVTSHADEQLKVGIGTLNAQDSIAASKGVYFETGVAEAHMMHSRDTSYGGFGFGAWHDPYPQTGSPNTGVNTMVGWTTSDIIHRNNNTDTGTYRTFDNQVGAFAIFKVTRKNATEFTIENGLGTVVTTTGAMHSPLPIAFNSHDDGGPQIVVNWVFVRKYAAVEPTYEIIPEGLTGVEVLVVAGGGGGGMNMGGGGGGGGVIHQNVTIDKTRGISVIVGKGGAGAPAGSTESQPPTHQFSTPSRNGEDSVFGSLIAKGGGGGGTSYYAYTPQSSGFNGGCGGGASGYSTSSSAYLSGGTAVDGQGFAGGRGGPQYYSGGGGGAGAVGTASPAQPHGGAGYECSILGTSYYWGGGGGGGGYTINGGNGGIGGGGGGAVGTTTGGAGFNDGQPGGGGGTSQHANTPGGDAGANTGGGGGGSSHYNVNNKGGDGGSGIVVVKYLTADMPNAVVTGASNYITIDGEFSIAVFLESGTFAVTGVKVIKAIECLIVAGGGGGGFFGGGGGAGGLIHEQEHSLYNAKYSVIVGKGGAATATYNSNYAYIHWGEDSMFDTFRAFGGGAGGQRKPDPYAGGRGYDGGSGGGGGIANTSPLGYGAKGVVGQGNDGGDGIIGTAPYLGGGGGGAGTVGQTAVNPNAGDGGDGLEIDISGTPTYYAGGGGGHAWNGGTEGAGGLGGGGEGSGNVPRKGADGVNCSGGGGGAGSPGADYPGGNGGDGIVIIKYKE